MPSSALVTGIGAKVEWPSMPSPHFGEAIDLCERTALVVAARVSACRETEDRGGAGSLEVCCEAGI